MIICRVNAVGGFTSTPARNDFSDGMEFIDGSESDSSADVLESTDASVPLSGESAIGVSMPAPSERVE